MIKESLIYSIGEFLFKGSRFILLPFYVSLLPSEEFGVLQQIIILTAFSDVFISLAVKQTMLRLYYDYDSKDQQKVFLGNMLFYIVLSYTVAIVIFSGTNLFSVLFNFNQLESQFSLILLYTFLFEILYMILTFYRIHRYLKKYLYLSVLVSLSEVIIIISMLYMDQLIAMVRIYGGLVACGLGIISILCFDRSIKLRFSIQKKIFRNYLPFAMPLIAINIMGWFIVSYDKILISDAQGITALAVYGLAFQLASIYKSGQMGFIRAMSVYIYEKSKTANDHGYVRAIGRVAALIYLLAAIVVIIVIYYLGPLLMPVFYTEAINLTIILIIAKFMLMHYMFNTTVLKLYKNTNAILILYFCSSLIFYFSCKTMIPAYGIIGGAFAHICTAVFLLISSQVYLRFKYVISLKIDEIISIGILIFYAVGGILLPAIKFGVITLLLIVSLTYYIYTQKEEFQWSKL